MCLAGNLASGTPRFVASRPSSTLWTVPAAGSAPGTGCIVPSRQMLPPSLRHQVFRGVYADARLEIDQRLGVDAAGLLMPAGTVIGGRSAAAAAGIADLIGDPEPVEVIAEPGVVFGPFKGMWSRRAELPRSDVLQSDPPRTTLIRTAVDIAREADGPARGGGLGSHPAQRPDHA